MIPTLTLCSVDRLCGMVNVYRVVNILTFIYLQSFQVVFFLVGQKALRGAHTLMLYYSCDSMRLSIDKDCSFKEVSHLVC